MRMWVLSIVCISLVQLPFSGSASEEDELLASYVALPVEVLRADGSIRLLTGIEDAALGTQGAGRRSPFKKEFSDQATPNKVPDAVWDYDFIDSYHKLTTQSYFGARSKAKGPFFRVAAQINRSNVSLREDKEVLIYAYFKVEDTTRQIALHDIDEAWLTPDVSSMLQDIAKAIASGDHAAAARVRKRFKRLYGTGFLASETRGGLYVVESRETYSTSNEKENIETQVSAAIQSVSANVNARDEQLSEVTKKLLKMTGRTYGGTSQIRSPKFEDFAAVANEWQNGLRSKTEEQRILAGTYVPYSAVPVLRPLSTGSGFGDPTTIDLLGNFGPLEAHNTGAIIAHYAAGKWNIQSTPLLLPTDLSVDHNMDEIVLSVVANPNLVGSAGFEARQATLTALKKAEHPNRVKGEAIRAATDAPFNEQLYVWPVLRIEDDSGGATTLEPVDDLPLIRDITEDAAYNRTADRRFGRFRMKSQLSADQWGALVQAKRVKLQSAISADLTDIVLSDAIPLISAGEPSTTGSKTKLQLSAAPLIPLNEASSFEAALDTRLLYWMYGPPYRRANPNFTGLLMTRSRWSKQRLTADYYCQPQFEILGRDLDASKIDPFAKVRAGAPTGMELVVLRKGEYDTHTPGVDFNKAAGCRQGGECTGAGEGCYSIYLDAGCYVDSAWLAWYRKLNQARGTQEDLEFICSGPTQSVPQMSLSPVVEAPKKAKVTDMLPRSAQ